MKIVILFILTITLFSCKKDVSTPPQTAIKGTLLTVQTNSDVVFDSMVVITQDQRFWKYKPYQPKTTFHFNDSIPQNYSVFYFLKGIHYYPASLWLNNGNPTIKVNIKDMDVKIDSVLNAPIYYDHKAFFDGFDMKSRDTVTINKFILAAFDKQRDNTFSNLIADNYILYNQNNMSTLKTIHNRIQDQNEQIKNKGPLKNLEKLLSTKKIDLSKFAFTDRDNKKVIIKNDANKMYLLDFWFVQCPPCVADHKIIHRRLVDYKKANIEIIGISTDRDYLKWNEYLKKHPYSWKNYRQDEQNKISDNLGIISHPTYYLLNNKMEIVKKYNFINEFNAEYLDKNKTTN